MASAVQVPQVSNQSPQVSDQSPQVSDQRPQQSDQTPQVSDQSPQISNQKPQETNQRAQWSIQAPQFSFQELKGQDPIDFGASRAQCAQSIQCKDNGNPWELCNLGTWVNAVGHQMEYLIGKEANPMTEEQEKIYGNLWNGWGIFRGLMGDLMGAQQRGEVESPWLWSDACFINGLAEGDLSIKKSDCQKACEQESLAEITQYIKKVFFSRLSFDRTGMNGCTFGAQGKRLHKLDLLCAFFGEGPAERQCKAWDLITFAANQNKLENPHMWFGAK